MKLLFWIAGWFVCFNGRFLFKNIGNSYTPSHVPYVGMRALHAINSIEQRATAACSCTTSPASPLSRVFNPNRVEAHARKRHQLRIHRRRLVPAYGFTFLCHVALWYRHQPYV